VAVEVQLGAVSDAEWLARHRDYAKAGIADVCLWHEGAWVPRVVFDAGQPGWILDLANDRLGLLHADPGSVPGAVQPVPAGCGQVHWPPCCGDQLGTLWISVESALLTPGGISAPPAAMAEIARRAAMATPAGSDARTAPAGTRQGRTLRRHPITPGLSMAGPRTGPITHQAFRYDARPSWTNPGTWWYLCDDCGRSRITGAELDASPIIHIVPTLERLTATGRPLVSYVPHRGIPGADKGGQHGRYSQPGA
jgi:hypothetical protein